MKKKILIVCKGNIHRSVIASFCIKKALQNLQLEDQYEVISRGLQGSCGTPAPKFLRLSDYPFEWSLTEPVLKEIGIVITREQKATPVVESDVAQACPVLAMDRMVLVGFQNSLVRQFPQLGFKMRLFQEISGKVEDVPDCGGSKDPKLFRDVILTINNTVQNHVSYLVQLAKHLSF